MNSTGSRAEQDSFRSRSDFARQHTQEDRILAMLRAAGAQGCTNVELWEICHAVNSRIADLRRRGYSIEATNESRGVWRYRLRAEESHNPIEAKAPESDFMRRRRVEESAALPLFAEVPDA